MAQLVVNLSCNTGPPKYGASGFLYGLGNAGIPSVNMLAPLKPRVAAQKPEGGLQHPNGDAFNVADTYQAAGGREIEIYLQDMYARWPYEMLGIEDYVAKVKNITHEVVAHPNPNLFSYVPLNEPDNIWYNKTDKKRAMFDDWKTLFEAIRSIDSKARIVGPNFARYDSTVYKEFLAFARDNKCLPDVVSWHELNDDFYTGWYSRYEDYRSIETSLDIPAREICINEYATISGDLGVPGKLVQWIARFENSKVDACLAYWTSAGCLNDLVARDTDNQATGGWWLYKWYASLTGHTVKVTPPDANAKGLQGLASLDNAKRQARIVFGGASSSADIIVQGLSIDTFGDNACVAVWAIESTGIEPSNGPLCLRQDNYPIVDGQLTVHLDAMIETSAYQMIITPSFPEPRFARQTGSPEKTDCCDNGNYYAAEYADLSSHGGTTFVVTASDNAFYNIRLSYSARSTASDGQHSVRMSLNDEPLQDFSISLTTIEDSWADTNINAFLTRGINRITFESLNEERAALNIDSIELTPGSGTVQVYAVAAAENILSGTAVIVQDPAAPDGTYVGGIGLGSSNFLKFTQVKVPVGGTYRMVVHFANAENRGTHDYNSQIVDRCANIIVNEGAAKQVYFRNTFAWNVYRTKVVDIELEAGENTIQFANDSAAAPHIAQIEIAARF